MQEAEHDASSSDAGEAIGYEEARVEDQF